MALITYEIVIFLLRHAQIVTSRTLYFTHLFSLVIYPRQHSPNHRCRSVLLHLSAQGR